MGRVVAVTGGTGFLGGGLVRELLKRGSPVRVLTRRAEAAKRFPPGVVEIWPGDLSDPSTLSGFVDGADTIYHAAGEIRNPRRYWAVNAVGTADLLHAARAAGVRRFLYLSSVGVTGASGAAGRVNETTPARPRNAYEASKYAGEEAVLRSQEAGGLQVSIVRPAIVFGEGRDPRADRFLPLVKMVQRGHFALLGEGYISNYTYLGDVVGACLTVAAHPETGGQIYAINEPLPWTVFVNELATQLGVRRPGLVPRPFGTLGARLLQWSGRFGSLYNRTVFAMDKLTALGFQLPHGYRQGLARTIAWYRQAGRLPREAGPDRGEGREP
ncbi:MAG: NAD(P)-dependent oxidoreductase [Deltaproteobacteria bacterium]|nr:NAD(P)-dependent oxidoreductase [Deltaproteobacteria bacterium]